MNKLLVSYPLKIGVNIDFLIRKLQINIKMLLGHQTISTGCLGSFHVVVILWEVLS